MTPALTTRNLSVGYRRHPAVLEHINLAAAPGEVVCLLGVNGIGKSTLMRTLAGMQSPLAGSVHVNGAPLSALSRQDRARRVAILLTERLAIGALSAQRLVELGRYPHSNWFGTITPSDQAVVDDAIAAVGASHLAQRDINALSDGERQRFMIARALAQEPALLLLDEPAAYLDILARVEMMTMLRRLAQERGVAVILSSHDLDLSLRMADTIWLITSDGTIAVGAPEDLLANGQIAEAFSGQTVLFDTAQRSFALRARPGATASLDGDAESLALAKTVLERAGYEILHASVRTDLRVTTHPSGWSAETATQKASGSTFAELAAFARQPVRQSEPSK